MLLPALVAAAALLAGVGAADARTVLGVYGDFGRFDRLTKQDTTSLLFFVNWNQNYKDYSRHFRADRSERPMLGLTMSRFDKEYLTPRQVARGRGDRHLIGIAKAAAASGKEVFIRPFAEMNGHWNTYCAYNANGTKRNAAHSQRWFKKAFRRVYLIMHGGDSAELSAKLRAIGLPGVSADVPANPYPQMTVIWNPQGFGSPNLKGNSAQAYWPGNRYVDWVGNDLYDISFRYAWEANLDLFKAHPTKPFSIPEWGLWGIDDPSFVRRIAKFARTHNRVKLITYYNGQAGGPFDLKSKPRSLAAYKNYIVPLGR